MHIVPQVKIGKLLLPTDVTVCPKTSEVPIHDFSNLLTVAYGLAYHAEESPDYFTPREVEPIALPEKITRPAWDIGPLD